MTPNEVFSYFRRVNVERCNAAFHQMEEWSLSDWALAFMGEAGELLNEVKKLRRDDGTGSVERLAFEIVDCLTYLDLLAARAGVDIWPTLVTKFNQVSERRCSAIRLEVEPKL